MRERTPIRRLCKSCRHTQSVKGKSVSGKSPRGAGTPLGVVEIGRVAKRGPTRPSGKRVSRGSNPLPASPTGTWRNKQTRRSWKPVECLGKGVHSVRVQVPSSPSPFVSNRAPSSLRLVNLRIARNVIPHESVLAGRRRAVWQNEEGRKPKDNRDHLTSLAAAHQRHSCVPPCSWISPVASSRDLDGQVRFWDSGVGLWCSMARLRRSRPSSICISLEKGSRKAIGRSWLGLLPQWLSSRRIEFGEEGYEGWKGRKRD